MSPCQICRGACCESLVTTTPPTDAGFWLALHGTPLGDGRVELAVRCQALDSCGACTIHSMRPGHCRAFAVGSPECRDTVARRRPKDAGRILAALAFPAR